MDTETTLSDLYMGAMAGVTSTPNYSVGIETMTPALAKRLLENNDSNRPVSDTTVELYAGAMKRGEWVLNGESIILSDDGELLQGQHRCKACILSGVPFKTVIVRGMPRSVFMTLDSGKKRNASDTLAIDGHKNTRMMASGARQIIKMVLKGRAASSPSTPMIHECVRAYPRLDYWSSRLAGSKARTIFPSFIVGILTLAEKFHGMDIVERFLLEIAEGIGIDRDSPTYILREKFIELGHGKRFGRLAQEAYIIKALNAHIAHKNIKFLRVTADEVLPKLTGLS